MSRVCCCGEVLFRLESPLNERLLSSSGLQAGPLVFVSSDQSAKILSPDAWSAGAGFPTTTVPWHCLRRAPDTAMSCSAATTGHEGVHVFGFGGYHGQVLQHAVGPDIGDQFPICRDVRVDHAHILR